MYRRGGDGALRVKARKVGNSIAVTIPKEMAEALAITSESEVELEVRGDSVIITAVASPWDRLVVEVRANVQRQGLTEKDVDQAITEIRGRKRRQGSPRH